jgi:putative DNA primase/helicase
MPDFAPDIEALLAADDLHPRTVADQAWAEQKKEAEKAKLNDSPDEPIGPTVKFSEDALALEFSAKYHTDWRYTALWGKWHQFVGTHWRDEDTLRVFELTKRIGRRNGVLLHDDDLKQARKLAGAATAAAVERMARWDRRHAMRFSQWDSNDWTFNHQGATVGLKNGHARPHRREDYCTKIAGCAADEHCPIPLWTAFLNTVTAGDQELQLYLQRVAGYCLTGITTEHALFFLHGTGGNGKGLFINTLRAIWGDYATVASMETFIETRHEQHSTDLAMLAGARLVIAQEVKKGQAWAEAKINSMTGGDPITARYMRQDNFTYQPKFKLMIAGNHKPSLRSVNEAARRRFNLIPFTVTIPDDERDKELFEKLKAEYPGILNWALQGCLEWQKIGLAPPQIVREASEAYSPIRI